jgi:hypothetical protein
LSDEEKLYLYKEDPTKNAFIVFEAPNFKELEGRDLVIFEERVSDSKGDWLIIERIPNCNEEELAKLKKSKGTKTLGLNDLNSIEVRTWVHLDQFLIAGV